MKKLLSISFGFLALASLVSLSGCGGSNGSNNYPQEVSQINGSDTRGVTISWPKGSIGGFTVVEYQIFRKSFSNGGSTEDLVGIVDGKTTTFDDTTATRTFTYSQYSSSKLTSASKTASGLTSGQYAYRVQGIYSGKSIITGDNYYGEFTALSETNTITFE